MKLTNRTFLEHHYISLSHRPLFIKVSQFLKEFFITCALHLSFAAAVTILILLILMR